MVEGEAAWVPDSSAARPTAAAKCAKKAARLFQWCVTTSKTCLANCTSIVKQEQLRFAFSALRFVAVLRSARHERANFPAL